MLRRWRLSLLHMGWVRQASRIYTDCVKLAVGRRIFVGVFCCFPAVFCQVERKIFALGKGYDVPRRSRRITCVGTCSWKKFFFSALLNFYVIAWQKTVLQTRRSAKNRLCPSYWEYIVYILSSQSDSRLHHMKIYEPPLDGCLWCRYNYGRVAEMKSAARPFMRRSKEYVADRLWKNKRLGKEKGMAKQTLG